MVLSFTVYGVAQPAGSKRAFTPRGWTRPIITDSNRNLKSWQQLVADQASHALERLPETARQILVGGVRLSLAIYLPRPKALAAKAYPAHTKKPDASKLVRAVEDALTGVVWRDDSQVVELVVGKYYAAPREPAHVHVRVEPTLGVNTLARIPPAPLPLFAS
jgi:Holliday junction resolvase RusA-like endonuclease